MALHAVNNEYCCMTTSWIARLTYLGEYPFPYCQAPYGDKSLEQGHNCITPPSSFGEKILPFAIAMKYYEYFKKIVALPSVTIFW